MVADIANRLWAVMISCLLSAAQRQKAEPVKFDLTNFSDYWLRDVGLERRSERDMAETIVPIADH